MSRITLDHHGLVRGSREAGAMSSQAFVCTPPVKSSWVKFFQTWGRWQRHSNRMAIGIWVAMSRAALASAALALRNASAFLAVTQPLRDRFGNVSETDEADNEALSG
jgi:hypothetical protein